MQIEFAFYKVKLKILQYSIYKVIISIVFIIITNSRKSGRLGTPCNYIIISTQLNINFFMF